MEEKKYFYSKRIYILPWFFVIFMILFCLLGFIVSGFKWDFFATKLILFSLAVAIYLNFLIYFKYSQNYITFNQKTLERHGDWKFWCKEIPYEDIEYIADDEFVGPLSILGIYHSRNWKFIEIFSKENPDGSKKIIRMIPYNLIGFDEFINELIKRSPNIKMIAPSLKKYLETGKIHRTDNGNMRQLMMGKSYLEMSDEELDKYRENAKK